MKNPIRSFFEKLRFAARSIKNPVQIVRLTDYDGIRRVVVVQRRPWGAKAIAKFEVLREFDPESTIPGWKEIGFRSFHFKERKVVAEPPATTSD